VYVLTVLGGNLKGPANIDDGQRTKKGTNMNSEKKLSLGKEKRNIRVGGKSTCKWKGESENSCRSVPDIKGGMRNIPKNGQYLQRFMQREKGQAFR